MSDDNKVGSSSGSPVNPDDAQYLAEAAAEEQLATPPAQAFSLNKQQDQSSTSDDTNTKSSKDAQKKEDIKKQQQQQAADAAAKQAQAAQKKPSPLDSSFHTNLKDQKTATPTTSAPLQTPKKEQPNPLSLPNTGEKLPSKDPSVLQDILKSPQPDTTSKNLGTPTKMDPKETLAPLTNALKSAGQDDFVKASSLNQQTSADSTANKMQNSQTTSSLSQHTTDVQTITSDKDTDWKDKQTTVRKDDIEQTHLDRKFTGDKIETQIQTKIETTNEITPSSGSTGTNIAERAAQAIATQTDFINLVASVATNQKTTQVQLKDGTVINLDRTDRGLNISVTTADTRVQRLLMDNRSAITQALSAKNIPVADLQVSMEYGSSGKPIEGIGRE